MLLAAATSLVALLPTAADAVETDTFRFAPSPARVQGLERRTFAYAIEPGESVGDAVRIVNLTDEPRRFRLYGADARTDPADGGVTVAPGSATPSGVGTWVQLEQAEVELDAGESVVVPFVVARPDDSVAEGVGAVVAEEMIEDVRTGGIAVAYRLAILVRLDGDVAGLRVGPPRMDPPVELFPASSSVEVDLENETLEPLTATVAFTASGLTGRFWDLGEQELRIQAGQTRTVTASWNSVPRWGGYFSPAVAVSWERGSIVRTGPRALHPPLWLLGLAIVIVGVRAGRELRDRRRHPQIEPAPIGGPEG